MPLGEKKQEIARLAKVFEAEAEKFHPLSLSLVYVTQSGSSTSRKFAQPNHAIMLWQYYGAIEEEDSSARFAQNMSESDMQWGLRGAQISCFGVLEGEGCELFIRMAQRAGSLFDEAEANALKVKVVEEIIHSEQERNATAKPVATSNSNPLAIWLNYLLFHLSITNPGRERATKIEPDPFALSLLAIDRLQSELIIGKADRSARRVSDLSFLVALSFPGERRPYVAAVANVLRGRLPPDSVFYDYDYQAQLARPNMDLVLQDIYRSRSRLVVVFLCEEYSKKEWCGLEWRSVRELIKSKRDEQVMFVRFDDAEVEGLLAIDGYIDARANGPEQVAEFVLQRVRLQE